MHLHSPSNKPVRTSRNQCREGLFKQQHLHSQGRPSISLPGLLYSPGIHSESDQFYPSRTLPFSFLPGSQTPGEKGTVDTLFLIPSLVAQVPREEARNHCGSPFWTLSCLLQLCATIGAPSSQSIEAGCGTPTCSTYSSLKARVLSSAQQSSYLWDVTGSWWL